MRQAVRDAWLGFTEPMEGGVPALYLDVRGIPTIAYGSAVFTPSECAALPLMHPGGLVATPAEKIALWHTVHDDARAAHLGWRYAATLSDLRLTREGMGSLALAKLDSNDRILLARLPEWESYPACAQVGMHSLAWACGANAHFPRLFQAVADRDFERAAVEIYMNEMTPEGIRNLGLVPRNHANKVLMRNAQRVESFHLDPDLLDWEHDLSVSDAVTVPSLDNAASSPTIHPSLYSLDDPDDEG